MQKISRSRRHFLRSSAFTAAAFGLGSERYLQGAPRVEAKPAPVKLGLASYTFRQFSREQVIGFMRELNLTELNAKDVKDHLPMDPTAEAQALADYGAHGIHVHAVGAVNFPTDQEADVRGKFEYAQRAGVKVIVAGGMAPATLPVLERFVREYDIRLAIHNHGPEDPVWHSPLDVLRAVKALDPRLGCCIDVGHCARAGVDVVEAIHAVGPRLFNVHFKDLTDTHAKESQVAVGDGVLPVRAILAALIEQRYEGFVDLEYEVHADDPMPGVNRSFAFMRGVLAGMGYAHPVTTGS